MQNLKTVDFGVAFTLTRPAPADYEDKDGNTQTAAANEPRFNYSNGVAQGLMLDASLSETAAIDDVPLFNASAGHWIIDATFDDSEPLKGMGLDERFDGSGKMVVSYSGGTAKVWAGGQAIHTVTSYTPAEPTHICEGGMATIGSLVYKPSAISDADAAALATGDFEIYEWTPAELFEASQDGAWYDPSDLTTLFQDAAGTTPVTGDGDPVGLMLDKSGNDNHAAQSTTAAKPVYRTNGTLHWVEFDGVDDALTTNAAAISGLAYSMIAAAANNFAENGGPVFATSNKDTTSAALYLDSRSSPIRVARVGVGKFIDRLTEATVNQAEVLSVSRGAETASAWVNGVLQGTTPTNDSSLTFDDFRLGGYGIVSGSVDFYGGVAVSEVITDEARNNAQKYFADKSGVTLS